MKFSIYSEQIFTHKCNDIFTNNFEEYTYYQTIPITKAFRDKECEFF